MARSHFRLTVSTLDLSTPLVPRGQLHAWDFALAAERSATTSWLPTATSHSVADRFFPQKITKNPRVFGSWDVLGWLGTVWCGARFMKRIQAVTEDTTTDKKNQNKNKKTNRKNKPKKQKQRNNKKTSNKNKPKNQKQKNNKNKTMGITRPKANKPMSKRRRTKYNDKNFHVQYFITAPKQQSNNAKKCQHQNNVARGPGPRPPATLF